MNPNATPAAAAPTDPRSPLLDWLAALRGGWGALLACAAAGAALASAPLLFAPPRAFYTSVATLATEPDLIGLAIGKEYAELLPRRERANTEAIFDAMFFENVARSGRVIGAAAARVGDEQGISPENGFGEEAALGEGNEFDPETAERLAEGHLRFDYKTGDSAIKVAVAAASAEYAREFCRAFVDEAARAYAEARRRKHRSGFQDAEARLAEIARRMDRIGGALRSFEKKEAAGGLDEKEQEERGRLQREKAELTAILKMLFRLRYLYLSQSEAPVVSISMVNEPSLPARSVRAWGWRAALPPVGAGLGLAFGLMLLAVRMHRAAMAELNPARYGRAPEHR